MTASVFFSDFKGTIPGTEGRQKNKPISLKLCITEQYSGHLKVYIFVLYQTYTAPLLLHCPRCFFFPLLLHFVSLSCTDVQNLLQHTPKGLDREVAYSRAKIMVMSRGHLICERLVKYDDGLIILENARFIKKEKKKIHWLIILVHASFNRKGMEFK